MQVFEVFEEFLLVLYCVQQLHELLLGLFVELLVVAVSLRLQHHKMLVPHCVLHPFLLQLFQIISPLHLYVFVSSYVEKLIDKLEYLEVEEVLGFDFLYILREKLRVFYSPLLCFHFI